MMVILVSYRGEKLNALFALANGRNNKQRGISPSAIGTDLAYGRIGDSSAGGHFGLAFSAPFGSPKEGIAALCARIAFLLGLDPFLGPELFPLGNRVQDDRLSRGKRKRLDEGAGKIGALKTPFVSLFFDAALDGARPAIEERGFGETPLAPEVFHLNPITRRDLLLEGRVIRKVRTPDGAGAAIEPARGKKLTLNCHLSLHDRVRLFVRVVRNTSR